MRKKIDILAILLVILLALSLGLGAVSVYCDHAYRETLSSNNALGELLDDLAAAADTGGAPAVENFDFSPTASGRAGPTENFNAVLVDEDGAILAQTGALACGDVSTLDVMLARYERPIELSAADGSTAHRTTWARLGLLAGRGQPDAVHRLLHRRCAAQDRQRACPHLRGQLPRPRRTALRPHDR